jgi:hypothetical protein
LKPSIPTCSSVLLPPACGRPQPPAIDSVEGPEVDLAKLQIEVGHASLGLPAGLQHLLIRVGAADDLHDGKPLCMAIGRQFAKVVERHPLGKTFPPRVTKPEKRRAVGVREVPPVVCHANESASQNPIAALVGPHREQSPAGIETAVLFPCRLDSVAVVAGSRRCKPHRPGVAAGPERRHGPGLRAAGEDDVDLDVGERVGRVTRRRKRRLEDSPDSRHACRIRDRTDRHHGHHQRRTDSAHGHSPRANANKERGKSMDNVYNAGRRVHDDARPRINHTRSGDTPAW